MELLSRQLGAASLRSPGDVKESLRGGPQAPCSFKEGSEGASPMVRSQRSVGGGVELPPPEVRRRQKHKGAKGQKRGSCSSDKGASFLREGCFGPLNGGALLFPLSLEKWRQPAIPWDLAAHGPQQARTDSLARWFLGGKVLGQAWLPTFPPLNMGAFGSY